MKRYEYRAKFDCLTVIWMDTNGEMKRDRDVWAWARKIGSERCYGTPKEAFCTVTETHQLEDPVTYCGYITVGGEEEILLERRGKDRAEVEKAIGAKMVAIAELGTKSLRGVVVEVRADTDETGIVWENWTEEVKRD